MKKLLPLLLVIFILTSCGTATKQPTETTPVSTEVELTVDNLSEYLEFKPKFENSTHTLDIFYHSDFSFECYAIRGGWFNNVEITVEITMPEQWFFEGTSDELGVYSHKITSTIRLPANGSYESDAYEVFAEQRAMPEEKIESYKIISVSGTFSKN